MQRVLISGVLLMLSVAVLVLPDLPFGIAGFSRLGEPDPAVLDEPFAVNDEESPRLLAARNRVHVIVPRDMTVGFFLRLYQIYQEHVRRQIAAQLGRPSVGDGDLLRAGTELDLELTPPGER